MSFSIQPISPVQFRKYAPAQLAALKARQQTAAPGRSKATLGQQPNCDVFERQLNTRSIGQFLKFGDFTQFSNSALSATCETSLAQDFVNKHFFQVVQYLGRHSNLIRKLQTRLGSYLTQELKQYLPITAQV